MAGSVLLRFLISVRSKGKYLASGSARDSSLYIWNVENREATLLQKIRGGGYTFLTWSPTGDRLLAGTPGSVFKLAYYYPNLFYYQKYKHTLMTPCFCVQNLGNSNLVSRNLGCDGRPCPDSCLESVWN